MSEKPERVPTQQELRRATPYEGDNLRITPAGYRRCRACGTEKQRRIRAQRRAAQC